MNLLRTRFLPLLLATLFAVPAMAESITTLQLRNRSAEEIIPVIEPLLEPGVRISGYGFKLIVRGSPEAVADVEAMIASLDLAAKTLMISVFQGHESELDRFDFSGSIRIDDGDVSGSVSIGQAQGSASGGPLQQLRVNEGSEGFIATGISGSLAYESGANLASGFYVLPRLNGEDRVTLHISSFSNKPKANSAGIRTMQADTVISGRIGEWIPLGGVDQSSSSTRSDGIGQRSTSRSQKNRIWIRADLTR